MTFLKSCYVVLLFMCFLTGWLWVAAWDNNLILGHYPKHPDATHTERIPRHAESVYLPKRDKEILDGMRHGAYILMFVSAVATGLLFRQSKK